jgi:hypothetical protein
LLLDLLKGPEAPKGLAKLPQVQVLQWVWQRHYERKEGQVRFRAAGESRPAGGDIESPYDTDARFAGAYPGSGLAIWLTFRKAVTRIRST